MRAAGVAFAVADSHASARAAAHRVTRTAGGHGAVREVCDALLAARRGARMIGRIGVALAIVAVIVGSIFLGRAHSRPVHGQERGHLRGKRLRCARRRDHRDRAGRPPALHAARGAHRAATRCDYRAARAGGDGLSRRERQPLARARAEGRHPRRRRARRPRRRRARGGYAAGRVHRCRDLDRAAVVRHAPRHRRDVRAGHAQMGGPRAACARPGG